MKKIKNNYLLVLVVCFSILFISFNNYQKTVGKVQNPYATLKCDSIIAYDYDGHAGEQIVSEGKLTYRKISAKKKLSKEQISKIHVTIGDPKNYGGSTAACFDPHMGFVYYKSKKIVGYISICLECNFLMSSKKIPASETKKMTFENGNFYYLKGFSKNGRKKINSICKELKFSHCKDKLDGMFDE